MDIFNFITPTVFNDFIKSIGGRKTCMGCGSENIYFPTTRSDNIADENSGKDHHYVWPSIINASFDMEPDNAQYIIVCRKCGFISYYHSVIVIDWYSKKYLHSSKN